MSKLTMSFTYRNHLGRVAMREVANPRIWYGHTDWHKNDQWLLTAYCLSRHAHRDFAFKDILTWDTLQAQFQARVEPWMDECFGQKIASNKTERNHRFLEEALELVQANGCTAQEAHQLVDYTYGRPIGEIEQEVGGVMVTLAALCLASDQDMHTAGNKELTRIWGKIEQIRAKQAAKPKHGPLPGPDGGAQ